MSMISSGLTAMAISPWVIGQFIADLRARRLAGARYRATLARRASEGEARTTHRLSRSSLACASRWCPGGQLSDRVWCRPLDHFATMAVRCKEGCTGRQSRASAPGVHRLAQGRLFLPRRVTVWLFRLSVPDAQETLGPRRAG